MPLDFPSNPTNGQVYETYIYDSSIASWRSQGSTNNLGVQIAALQASGTVVQIVTANTSTQVNVSSTTKLSTGLSVTITPKFANSKIAIIATSTNFQTSTNRADFAIFRNGTELSIGSSSNTTGVHSDVCSGHDFPGLTSAITYNLRVSMTSGTLETNWAGFPGNMIVMELKA